MKTLIVTLICSMVFTLSNAQQNIITGTWNVVEFTKIIDGKPYTTNKRKLKEEASVWELSFMKEGVLKQTSNMRNGAMESWNGTWEQSTEELTLKLQLEEREIQIVYSYELNEDILVLKRSNPTGTWKVVGAFQREKSTDHN